MKKLYSLTAAILISVTIWAQAPEKISYQAVVRNSIGQLISTQSIGMQISILLTSESGSSVYVERHFPTTNINGLVTIEIGNGIVVSGNFSSIDWANGPYFIKTETDLNGGATYAITGTSQLLSVPFALHAKTAETFSETDPVYAASQAVNITNDDITKLGNLSGENTGDQDGSETKVTSGSNTTITGTGTIANPYVINAETATSLTIGQRHQGGIIFWLDATRQHGLIVATADQSTGIQWYNGINRITGTSGDGLYAGKMNTAIIIATQMADNQSGNFAAKVCADYSVTYDGITYGDWYLPSIYELNLLYLEKSFIDGLATDNYWSSTEADRNIAWSQSFNSGAQGYVDKANLPRVRAIRSF